MKNKEKIEERLKRVIWDNDPSLEDIPYLIGFFLVMAVVLVSIIIVPFWFLAILLIGVFGESPLVWLQLIPLVLILSFDLTILFIVLKKLSNENIL